MKRVRELKKITWLGLAGMLLLSTSLLILPVGSDIIVPFEWIVPGAYARYKGGWVILFYPNQTEVDVSLAARQGVFLEWTVLDRVDDSVRLNLTFHAEGRGIWHYWTSASDGKVDIRDIALVAKAFGRQAYEWEYKYHADVTGSTGEPDYKIDILDISFVAKAYGSTPGDPKWNSRADIAPEEQILDMRNILHHKTLMLDIDIYSRETFLEDKPLGKTCFWADPYADIGDEMILYGLPPDEIIGTVTSYKDWTSWPGVTAYRVLTMQIEPLIIIDPCFDWDTGMALQIYLQGSQPVDPNNPHLVGFPNGTEYDIYRYAVAPIATELNIGIPECYFKLNSTNVQLGPPQ